MLAGALVMGACSEGSPESEAEQITVSPSLSTDGVYQVRWQGLGAVAVEVEESASPDFDVHRAVYRGEDKATTMTGREDGTWYYRVREVGSATPSDVSARVDVRHHSLPRAFGYFAVGLIVFAATTTLVFAADRRTGDG